MSEVLKKFNIRREPALYVGEKRVLDERGLRLISILDSVNSLLEASKTLGIPYSRAWEYIAKLERVLKVDIIKVSRGARGGLMLTPVGLEIVRYIKNSIRELSSQYPVVHDIDFHIAGSDDTLLSSFIGIVKRENEFNILYSKIGSLRGLFSLLMGDANIAPIHLFDPDTGEYNIPYVRKLGLDGYTLVIRGYEREVGFIYRRNIQVNSIDDIFRNKYRIVNRCKGAGIRILLDTLLREYAEKEGSNYSDVINMLKGYSDEVETHKETITRILEGSADIALGLRIDAISAGLAFTPLRWESYDFVIARDIANSEKWRKLYSLFKDLIPDIIRSMEGYRLPKDFGKPLNI